MEDVPTAIGELPGEFQCRHRVYASEVSKSGGGITTTEVNPGVSDGDRSTETGPRIPVLNCSATGRQTRMSSGDRPGAEFKKRESPDSPDLASPSTVTRFTATALSGDPERISGSQPPDLLPNPVAADGMSAAGPAVVSYTLDRLH